MTKHVAVLLAHGFEEAEAVILSTSCVVWISGLIFSPAKQPALSTYFETPISADALLSDRLDHHYDAVMMPGGPKAQTA